MPKHGVAPDFSIVESEAIRVARRALTKVVDWSAGTAAAEDQLSRLLTEVGRGGVQEQLEELSEQDDFTENGVRWWVAVRAEKKFLTSFGWVAVMRPLFRSTRNGATRCIVSERAGLFEDKWTPRAARAAAVVTAELPFGRAEALFRELGGMAPSRTLLQRFDRHLLDLWEQDRAKHEERVRAASLIPSTAVIAVASLDGVMLNMVGSDRAETVARALDAGRSPKGPSGYKEAAVAVVALYDAEGVRLATWRQGRMPEQNKGAVKEWLRSEVAWLRRERPDLRIVAAADGAENNWTFLKTLDPDVEVVDYYHVVEYVSRWLSAANGPSSLDTQKKLCQVKGLLLTEKDGAQRAFAIVVKAVRAAGPTASTKKNRYKPHYLEKHKGRMNYAELREQCIPIGTGVTEGTCRFLVVDRLRRSGMTWSEAGGQAVLNLRSLLVSDQFEVGWGVLVEANAERLQQLRRSA